MTWRNLLAAAALFMLCCRCLPMEARGQGVNHPVLPDLTFHTYENESIRTGDLKGDVVFVYLWAVDCRSCVAARAAIERLDKQFAVQGIWFLSVDEDANKQSWRGYLRHNPSPMTEVWDQHHILRGKLRSQRLPAAFAVDRSGHIQWKTARWSDKDEAETSTQLTMLLQEPKP